MDKIFPVWKPKGPTSFDIIRKFQQAIGKTEKIGHGGTLDPLASGVLVVAVGREATKKIHEVVGAEKEYIARIELGATSTTDDAEGELTKRDSPPLEKREIIKVVNSFVGKIFQTPPAYSALKIKGQPAYKLARKGKEPEMKAREVEVRAAEILDYNWPFITVKFVTGPGVYIRALARDIGEKLGVGGYLADLERTRVGHYIKEEALSPEEAIEKILNDKEFQRKSSGSS